jgi:hypothetical protein
MMMTTEGSGAKINGSASKIAVRRSKNESKRNLSGNRISNGNSEINGRF